MLPEKKSYIARVSGVEVTQLTDYKGHSHHFYFTNSGWYAGGRKLLFSSERNNRRNLYGVDLETGEIEQLTDLDPAASQTDPDFLRACKNPTRILGFRPMAAMWCTHPTDRDIAMSTGCPWRTLNRCRWLRNENQHENRKVADEGTRKRSSRKGLSSC